jgi:hypothetical protein
MTAPQQNKKGKEHARCCRPCTGLGIHEQIGLIGSLNDERDVQIENGTEFVLGQPTNWIRTHSEAKQTQSVRCDPMAARLEGRVSEYYKRADVSRDEMFQI